MEAQHKFMWLILSIIGLVVAIWYIKETMLNPRYGDPFNTAPILMNQKAQIIILAIIGVGVFSLFKFLYKFAIFESLIAGTKLFFSFKMLPVIFIYAIGDTVLNLIGPFFINAGYMKMFQNLAKFADREKPPDINELTNIFSAPAKLPTYLAGLLSVLAVLLIMKIHLDIQTLPRFDFYFIFIVLILGLINGIIQRVISGCLIPLGSRGYAEFSRLIQFSGIIQLLEGTIIFYVLLFVSGISIAALNIIQILFVILICLIVGFIISMIINTILSLFGGLFGSVIRAINSLLPISLYITYYFYLIKI